MEKTGDDSKEEGERIPLREKVEEGIALREEEGNN